MSNSICRFKACLLQYLHFLFLFFFFAADLNKEGWLSTTILVFPPFPHPITSCIIPVLSLNWRRRGGMATKGERWRSREGNKRAWTSKKKRGEKTFAMPIIFKELRAGPHTEYQRLKKKKNAGAHHAVGMWCWLINYFYGYPFMHQPLIIYIFSYL